MAYSRSRILRAIHCSEIDLRYQAIHEIATDAVYGYEVLVRWQHPQQGELSPASFIEQVENDPGLELRLLRYTISKIAAFRQAQKFMPTGPVFSVNISLNLLKSKLFYRYLRRKFAQGTTLTWLILEIVERGEVMTGVAPYDPVAVLRMYGIKFLLDDFGTGTSSWFHLVTFDVDGIKIDRSFVGLLGTPKGDAIVRSMISTANELGISVTAEGVETADQLSTLRALPGVLYWQGFLSGRPMKESALVGAILNSSVISA